MEINRIAAPVSAVAKPQSQEDKQLLAACREFEAIMLQQMMKSMRATVPKSETASFATDVVQDLYDEKLSDELAQSGGIGLAQVLFRQLQRRSNP